jgi:hypothetical protein
VARRFTNGEDYVPNAYSDVYGTMMLPRVLVELSDRCLSYHTSHAGKLTSNVPSTEPNSAS